MSLVSPQRSPSRARPRTGSAAGGEEIHADAPVIYIVDDDEAVRSALRLLVKSLGWGARSFDGGAALLAEKLPPADACVLLDLNMPGMNGAEVLEQLRAQGCRLPVIGITAERESPLIRRMRAAGALTVLFKPVHDEALRAAVAGALKSH